MSKFHLLYWIFKWLKERHSTVYEEMHNHFYAYYWNGLSWTLQQSLNERITAFEKVYKENDQ